MQVCLIQEIDIDIKDVEMIKNCLDISYKEDS